MSTKQKILNAAMQVLIDDGFSAMTQTLVAKNAGIGQGLLTYHFPTRNHLLTAVVDESKLQMSRKMMKMSDDDLTLVNFADVLSELGCDKSFVSLMLTLTSAALDDRSLHRWFVDSDKDTRKKLHDTFFKFGYKIGEDALHLFRSSLIGASIIQAQQNTKMSKDIHLKTVKLAITQLLKNATRVQSETETL